MRGGRNIVERVVKAGRGDSGASAASATFTGMTTCPTFGRP